MFDKISDKKRRKKEEEERLAKELKEIKLQRQYLNASKVRQSESIGNGRREGLEGIRVSKGETNKRWTELTTYKPKQTERNQGERAMTGR